MKVKPVLPVVQLGPGFHTPSSQDSPSWLSSKQGYLLGSLQGVSAHPSVVFHITTKWANCSWTGATANSQDDQVHLRKPSWLAGIPDEIWQRREKGPEAGGSPASELRVLDARVSHIAKQRRLPALSNLIFPGTETGMLLWTPNLLKPCTLEILASNLRNNLSSVLQPKMVVCTCKAESQCVYSQTKRIGNSSLMVSAMRRAGRRFLYLGGKV